MQHKRFWVMKIAQCSWHSFFLLILCCSFFFYKKKTQIDCLVLKYVMIREASSCLLQISSETPSECMFCLIQPLGNFGWWKWSHLTFNQSTEILIPRFIPFFLFKNFYYSAQQENIRLWDRPCEPLKDYNGFLHFGIWPSETFLIKGCHGSIDPVEAWWYGLIPKGFR